MWLLVNTAHPSIPAILMPRLPRPDPSGYAVPEARVLFQEASELKGKAKPEAVHPQCLKERH